MLKLFYNFLDKFEDVNKFETEMDTHPLYLASEVEKS